MRFAELLTRCAAVSVLVASAAGCATVNEIKDKVMTVASATPSAAASAPVAAAAAKPAAPVVNDTPLSPNVQRAFDDAVRAQRAGKSADAERGYRALVQSNPELGGPHANLGVIYRQAGKVDDAVRELETAVKLSPRQPIYLNQLGIAYRQQGQFAKARDAYQRALAQDPGYAGAMLNLGILYDLYLGDTQRALEQYARYLSLFPNGDPTVSKWVADLKNRKPGPITVSSRQEKP
jgi:tetratricopeptide (TPR) repeat protein